MVLVRRLASFGLMIGTVLLGWALVAPKALAKDGSRFTRSWEKNEKQSDDPQEKLQAAFETMRRQGGRRGGGMGHGGGRREGPRSLQRMLLASERLEILLREGEFHVVTADDAPVRIYYLDGKKHLREAPNGMKMETKAEKVGDCMTRFPRTARDEAASLRRARAALGDRRPLGSLAAREGR